MTVATELGRAVGLIVKEGGSISLNPAPPGPRVIQRGRAAMRSRTRVTADTPTEFGHMELFVVRARCS